MVHSVNCPTRVGNLEAWTVSGGPRAQSGGQAKKASVSSLDFA